MKKDYSHKITKLTVIAELTKKFYIITGIFSVAFMLLGGIIAAIVVGITGYNNIIRFVIAAFSFGIAIAALFADLHLIVDIWIAVLKRISGEIELRCFISAITSGGLILLIPLTVGFFAIKIGISYLLDPSMISSIT